MHRKTVDSRSWFRRHRKTSIALAVVVLLTPLWWSVGSAATNPALGTSLSGRFAEWMREHGMGGLVVWAENSWYSHHPPPVGGKPPQGAIDAPRQAAPSTTVATGRFHLAPPPPIVPFANPPIPGEGQWQAVGRSVDGAPAVYETRMRPDAVHTSVVVGVAWMDPTLLSATLYSGSLIPGGSNWQNTAPVSSSASSALVAAFNSGFLMSNANGGYYSEGKTVFPLRAGAASFVIYKDGSAAVGQWGRDVTLSPDVASVRQNLDLLVDGGQPVAGLNAADTTRWGFTLGNQVYVWRSGIGETASGALVYVGGPNLNITDLANLLARAGVMRGMELDINTDWVNLATFDPTSPQGLADSSNGTDLLPNMAGSPSRYFSSWSRDFITMTAKPDPASSAPTIPNSRSNLGTTSGRR